MKIGTGHSSYFCFGKFSHLIIDKVCHRQALFVFLPLFLLHISSYSRPFSGERCPFSPRLLPFIRLTSPTFLKKPWAFVQKQTSFRRKSTSFETKPTSKIGYWALPFGTPPLSSLSRWCFAVQRLFSKNSSGYSPPAPRNFAHVSHATRHAFQLPFLQSTFTSSLCPFDARSETILQKKAHICITLCPILHKSWGVR